MIDHIDGNGLNNCKNNLRVVSNSYNQQNRHYQKKGTSKYRGVCWSKRDNNWIAAIKKDSKSYYLGQYNSEVAAAIAYDHKARELYGETAYQNFKGDRCIHTTKAKGIDVNEV
jgi:hypothetical protein